MLVNERRAKFVYDAARLAAEAAQAPIVPVPWYEGSLITVLVNNHLPQNKD